MTLSSDVKRDLSDSFVYPFRKIMLDSFPCILLGASTCINSVCLKIHERLPSRRKLASFSRRGCVTFYTTNGMFLNVRLG